MAMLIPVLKIAWGTMQYIATAGSWQAMALRMAAFVAASATYSSYARRKAISKAASAAAAARQPITIKGSTEPAKILYGTRRVGGVIVFAGASGTKNEYLNVVIAFTVNQTTLVSVMVDEEVIPINGSGQPTSGKYVGKAQFIWHDGQDGQAADAGLVSAMPSQWYSTDTLSGIAYLYCWFKYDSDAFPGGALPNVTAVLTGKTTNVASAIEDWLTNETYGMGAPAARIDSTAMTAAIAVCNEDVDLDAGGTEKRYTYNAIHTGDQPHEEVLQEMLQACAGRLVYTGGKWVLTIGYQTPTVTITQAHMVAPIKISTRLPENDRANGVRGIFTSSDSKWQDTDYPAYQSPTYLADDDGFEHWLDINLPCTTSSPTAQRIARIELERLRLEISCELTVNLIGLQVCAGNTIMVTFAPYGWTSKTFEVVEWKLGIDDQEAPAPVIKLSLRETDANVYAWTTDDEQTLPASPATVLPDPWTVAVPSSVTLISSSDGLQSDGTVVPRLKLEWVAPVDQFVQSGGSYQIEYKLHAAETWTTWPWQKGDSLVSYITGVKIAGVYDGRIKALNILGVSSAWVTVESVTVAGDTVAPATVAGLTATAGTGKSISLDWTDNTETDLAAYLVYRYTSDSSGDAVKIAECLASRFVDVGVTLGSAYYYWIKAKDRSGNVSAAFSVEAHATVPYVVGGDTDQTAPTAPAAPTYDSEGTQDAGDGTVFAYLVVAFAALTAGAKVQYLQMRSTASEDEWIVVGGPFQNTGAAKTMVPDLSPGLEYEFRMLAVSFAGVMAPSATTLTRTAAAKSSGPGAPTSVSYTKGSDSGFNRAQTYTSGIRNLMFRANWTAPTNKDLWYYQWAFTTVDTDAAADAGTINRIDTNEAVIGSPIPYTGYFRVRSVNKSGQHSAWAGGGTELYSYWTFPCGDLSEQNKNAATVSGIETGDTAASSVQKVLCVYPINTTVSLTGGSTTEVVDLSLSNRGFGTKPDSGPIQCISDDSTLVRYDWDSASSTSTNARLSFSKKDGGNLSSGTYRIAGTFVEYD